MSSQTTTTPADRPEPQERNRRAEQRDVNLHVLADLRKSTFRKTPCKPLKNNVSLGVSKSQENRVMSTISQHNPAGKTSTYLATGQHPGVSHTRRTNDRKVQDKQRAKHPAGTDTTRLRLTHIQQRQFVRPTYALPHNLRATPSTSACHSACHHCRACHRRPTARAPRHAAHPDDAS